MNFGFESVTFTIEYVSCKKKKKKRKLNGMRVSESLRLKNNEEEEKCA